MQIGTPEAGRYKAVLSSDDKEYGGQGRIDGIVEHFTHPEGTPGMESCCLQTLYAHLTALALPASAR